jgi:hypothetical protein
MKIKFVKIYDFFRYDLPRFFRNLWNFRKELWNFQPWDYAFNLNLLKRSLILTSDSIEKYGIEEDVSRGKKIAKMKRAIQILNNICESDYISQAETILQREVILSPLILEDAELEKNREIFNLATKLEKEEWEELWTIVEGQKYEDFLRMIEEKDLNSGERERLYREWQDGSGMQSWWD